jgi:hypothetical protein
VEEREVKRCSVKIEFMASSPEEKAQNIVKVKVHGKWIEALRSFAREHNKAFDFRMIVEEWSDASEGAFNLFHELRDRIAEKQGDTSNENKDNLKKWLKQTYGVRLSNGLSKSTTKYTVEEMSRLIDGTFQECYKCEADVRDLEPERT